MHCHLIYSVDDGPSLLKESVRMAEEAVRAGVSTIIATPHINERNVKFDYIFEHLYDLVEAAGHTGLEIRLGAEIAINPVLPELIAQNETLRMAGTRYVLIEFPFEIFPKYSRDVLYELRIKDYIPVIAHPERNRKMLKEVGIYIELIDSGCLMQLDAASILGKNGLRAKWFCRKVLKANLVHFVASDSHSSGSYYKRITKAYRKVAKWTSAENAERLFTVNGTKLLANDIIENINI